MAQRKESARQKEHARKLRAAAEDRLAQSPGALGEMAGTSATNIIHELQVHQIELEMQNEELREAQLALEESRDKYQDLYEFAPVGYFTLTRAGRIVEANLAGAAMLAIAQGKVVGRGLGAFVTPEDLARWDQHLLSTAGSADRQTCEMAFRRGDGSTFHVRLDSVRLGGAAAGSGKGGGSMAIRTAMSDITETVEARRRNEDLMREAQRANRELERSNRDLEQFAHVASHDLQEPLRQVASFAELLRDRCRGRLDAKSDECLGRIMDGTLRMGRLIADLLAYARVDAAGRQPEPVSCQEAMDKALANLESAIADTGARVSHDPLPALPADAGQMAQLFQNLIGNAVKFHRPGVSPEVRVAARREGERWVLSVADNGIGIPPEHLDDVFAIFHRLHTQAQYPGTGIGLAICRKIVDRLGGRIWAESREGSGTTFLVSLPAATAAGVSAS